MSRHVLWWSAGAASAVACKLVLAEDTPSVIAYIDTRTEHPDNARFLQECSAWYGLPIETLASEAYHDTWDVFERTRWLVGPAGARCTTELKKKVRRGFERPSDVQVFGFTVEERARAERFAQQNPETRPRFPLIEQGFTKADCLAFLRRADIALPAMYLLGYRNNNCLGCVKGGAGYWNKLRVDFPEVFDRMAKVEREIGASIIRRTVKKPDGSKERVRVYLDQLEPDRGRYKAEPTIACGLACESAYQEAAE